MTVPSLLTVIYFEKSVSVFVIVVAVVFQTPAVLLYTYTVFAVGLAATSTLPSLLKNVLDCIEAHIALAVPGPVTDVLNRKDIGAGFVNATYPVTFKSPATVSFVPVTAVVPIPTSPPIEICNRRLDRTFAVVITVDAALPVCISKSPSVCK
jgi:hypothetical protein